MRIYIVSVYIYYMSCILTWSRCGLPRESGSPFSYVANKLSPICRNSDDLRQKTLRKRKTMTRIEYVPLHLRPSLPKDTKTCTDPKFSKKTCLCWNYQANPDSWESWARAGFVYFIQQDSWKSWVCAWILHLHSKGSQNPRCTRLRFPSIKGIEPAEAQDSQEKNATLSGACLIAPKSLGSFGNLGRVQVFCTMSIRIPVPVPELCLLFFSSL